MAETEAKVQNLGKYRYYVQRNRKSHKHVVDYYEHPTEEEKEGGKSRCRQKYRK